MQYFYETIKLGNFSFLQNYLSMPINIKDDNYKSLQLASEYGQLKILMYLFNKIEKREWNNIFIEDMLTKSSKNGHFEVVKFLFEELDKRKISEKISINSAFQWACHNGHQDIIEYLYNNKKKDDGLDIIQSLELCCAKGHLSILEFIINKLDTKLYNMSRLITIASKNDQLNIIEYLISLGVDFKANNNAALISAAKNGSLRIVKYLINLGANFRDLSDLPLRSAYERGHIDIVEYLILLGADYKGINPHTYINILIERLYYHGHFVIALDIAEYYRCDNNDVLKSLKKIQSNRNSFFNRLYFNRDCIIITS